MTQVDSKPRLTMTDDEWRDWYDEEGQCRGWVDGEMIFFLTPPIVHQRILSFVAMLVGSFVDRDGLGKVLLGPVETWLACVPSARTPGILLIANGHKDRITEDRVEGPANLVEIVSPESVTRDRCAKLCQYGAVGVPEYLIVDSRPGQEWVGMYRPGRSLRGGPADGNGSFHSSVLPGFWLDPRWLCQDPLPRVSDLLALMIP